MAEQEPRLTSEKARAASTPGVMRYVLSISLVAIVVILAIILIIYH